MQNLRHLNGYNLNAPTLPLDLLVMTLCTYREYRRLRPKKNVVCFRYPDRPYFLRSTLRFFFGVFEKLLLC